MPGSHEKKLWSSIQGRLVSPFLPQLNKKLRLQVALAPLGRVHCIFRGLDVRTDVGHREALILFTGTLGTLPQVLFHLIERHLPAAVDAYILPRTDFLSGFCFLGQFDHQIQI